uniref:Squalene cyclase C-terminal domain-containing protein n=1 Tax=Magnetococcus massalia (strain MO-1) TaxID=451514 RepID=A0A1S7LQK1_MAGMO|nr:Conserved protein of unknown function. putative terpenoid cyclases/Protein prenyltransferases [Candidatus Magnetococcus massalia]
MADGFLDKVAKTLYHHYRIQLFSGEARAELRAEGDLSRREAGDDTLHLRETLDWLCRAHDATNKRGVARGYAAAWNFNFDARGWQPAYPETTGYIVPTFLDCAKLLSDDDLIQRAEEMCDWEIAVQLDSGAVMGGTVDQSPSPAVFNTGQVILGWERAYRESGNRAFATAAERAADYLLSVQEPEGHWLTGNSQFADARTTTYNARVGWSLILLGQALERDDYIVAGRRNIDSVLRAQQENGWFRDNCLSNPEAPLLHTISYAIEGTLGAAVALKDTRYLKAAQLAADHLLPLISPEGRIPGRLGSAWQGRTSWDCLTGSAQLAGILLTLALELDEPKYAAGAQRLLTHIKRTQHLTSDHSGLRGGVKGSYPFSGGYGRFELLNWAAKFFIDALVLNIKWQERTRAE